jgi:hypothetical protein
VAAQQQHMMVRTSAADVVHLKGCLSSNSSRTITPRDHASSDASTLIRVRPSFSIRAASGGAYFGLKPMAAREPIFATSSKSMSTQVLVKGSQMMLPGFRSRCTYPAACSSSSTLLTWPSVCRRYDVTKGVTNELHQGTSNWIATATFLAARYMQPPSQI